MNNQPDDAIDKILAALRDAAPPEGMDSRIAARLAQHAQAQPVRSRWRNLLVGSSPLAAWGRGALTGAAAALLAVAAVLALHHASAPAPQQAVALPTHNPTITPVSASAPCAHPAAVRLATAARTHTTETPWTETIAENIAPSRPAPVMPLTAQERQLARLVHASDPGQLAAISHVTHAKPQDAAEDTRFFAPTPSQSTSETPVEPKPEPSANATPESAPEAAPETDQPSPEPDSDATPSANQ